MSAQTEIWLVALAGIALVAAGFLYVIVLSGQVAEPAPVKARAYRMRGWLFRGLIVLGVLVTVGTLRPFPIPPQHGQVATSQVMHVTAFQWAWQLKADTVRVGTPVEFVVASGDVNHGFGIYDSSYRILAQVQAMPGVTNRLVYTFSEPGTYHVLCLEYCGLGHHGMASQFQVYQAEAEVRP